MIRRLSALALLLAATTGFAETAALLEVREAWVAEAPPGARVQAAYMQLRNAGSAPLNVTAITSPAFESVELHRTVHDGGVARMERMARLDLPPGDGLSLAPGGPHLMLIGPRARVADGALVPLEFRLESGTVVKVDAVVRRAAPVGNAQHDHHHH